MRRSAFSTSDEAERHACRASEVEEEDILHRIGGCAPPDRVHPRGG